MTKEAWEAQLGIESGLGKDIFWTRPQKHGKQIKNRQMELHHVKSFLGAKETAKKELRQSIEWGKNTFKLYI
jgi:hypothetical protein